MTEYLVTYSVRVNTTEAEMHEVVGELIPAATAGHPSVLGVSVVGLKVNLPRLHDDDFGMWVDLGSEQFEEPDIDPEELIPHVLCVRCNRPVGNDYHLVHGGPQVTCDPCWDERLR